MKNFIFTLILSLVSICGFGQSNDSITIYYKNTASQYYHCDSTCTQLSKNHKTKFDSNKNIYKFIDKFALLPCPKCGIAITRSTSSGSYAKRYSTDDTFQQQKIEIKFKEPTDNIIIAGKLLKKSANFRFSAIGLTIGAGAVALFGSKQDKPKAFYAISSVMGVAALCCELTSIVYTHKAGKFLITYKLSQNGLVTSINY